MGQDVMILYNIIYIMYIHVSSVIYKWLYLIFLVQFGLIFKNKDVHFILLFCNIGSYAAWLAGS